MVLVERSVAVGLNVIVVILVDVANHLVQNVVIIVSALVVVDFVAGGSVRCDDY